jgi:5-methylcytosine-specific restriction endonuclease McrA
VRAPIAEKLAEPRKSIERIQATPRKGFTKPQRQAVLEKCNGCCAACGDELQPGWHIDHIEELADGGAHEFANWRALCPPCHRAKSAKMVSARAKPNRIRKREEEGPPPPQIRSRNEWPKNQKLRSRNDLKRNGAARFSKTRDWRPA